MDTTIFLSRLIGPLFFIVALGLTFSTTDYQKMLKEAMKSPFALYLSGFIAYIIGMLIVLNHNTWGWTPDTIVMIAGYAALVKGILLLLSPKWMTQVSLSIVESTNCLRSAGVVMLCIGAYLSYLGFLA